VEAPRIPAPGRDRQKTDRYSGRASNARLDDVHADSLSSRSPVQSGAVAPLASGGVFVRRHHARARANNLKTTPDGSLNEYLPCERTEDLGGGARSKL
jgi:hypothetical protein